MSFKAKNVKSKKERRPRHRKIKKTDDSSVVGGWTSDKSYLASIYLRTFLKEQHLETNQSCSFNSQPHESVTMKLSLDIKQLDKTLEACESGPTKKKAMSSCSLNLVRQLCELNLVEKFSEEIKEKFDNNDTSHLKKRKIDDICDEEKIKSIQPLNQTKEVNKPSDSGWSSERAYLASGCFREFVWANKLKAKYSYDFDATSQSVIAKISVYVKQINQTLEAQEPAQTKLKSVNLCSASLLRQLYELNLVEAFSSGNGEKYLKTQRHSAKRRKIDIPPWEVVLEPALEEEIDKALKIAKITPVQVTSDGCQSLLSDVDIDSFDSSFLGNPGQEKAIVNEDVTSMTWSKPKAKWNPWTGAEIEKGRLAKKSLTDISTELRESRERLKPYLEKSLTSRAQLPVAKHQKEILEAVYDNSVVLIRGNTGCGKSTQVCQFILDEFIECGSGAVCSVLVTQPRRISAVALAERVAKERCEEVGKSVGYSIRFHSKLPRVFGSILFCTVGVLLKRLESGLKGVSHIIVDEIHERDLKTDFALILLRDLVRTYPKIRLILMSATIDVGLFCKYFSNPRVIKLEGRTFPVQQYFLEDFIEMTNYQHKESQQKYYYSKDDEIEAQMEQNQEDMNVVAYERQSEYSSDTANTIKQIPERELPLQVIEAILDYICEQRTGGSILVFLPGWNAIVTVLNFLKKHRIFGTNQFVLLALHSQLPREDQAAVFDPVGDEQQKIILSTNIAESSITIDDVVYVIDGCRSRLQIYDLKNNTTHYDTVWAAKTNLKQRQGRAGRVRPGTCFHLCSKARYDRLPKHVQPEMLRCPLYEVALSVKLMRLGCVRSFLAKAMEPPPLVAVAEAEKMLKYYKCFDDSSELTSLGQLLARIPMEPRLSRMVLLGCLFGVADPLCIIAALTSTSPDVFLLKPEMKMNLNPDQRSFSGRRCSDQLSIVNVFMSWRNQTGERQTWKKKDETKGNSFCENFDLCMSRLKMTWDAKNQLKNFLLESGFPEWCVESLQYDFEGQDDRLDDVSALVTAGFYPNVFYHYKKNEVLIKKRYEDTLIHKSSANFCTQHTNFPTPFFVFGQKVTSKKLLWCKQSSMVSPLHLLLFGSTTVESLGQNKVVLDGWLPLKMSADSAAKVVALRPLLEAMVVRVAKYPNTLKETNEQHKQIIACVRAVCRMNGGRHGLAPLAERPQVGIKVEDNNTQDNTRHSNNFGKNRKRRNDYSEDYDYNNDYSEGYKNYYNNDYGNYENYENADQPPQKKKKNDIGMRNANFEGNPNFGNDLSHFSEYTPTEDGN